MSRRIWDRRGHPPVVREVHWGASYSEMVDEDYKLGAGHPRAAPRRSGQLRGERGRQLQRVSVVGNSGSGKSLVARGIAARLGVPHIELDAIFHQAGWTELPVNRFRRRVAGVLDNDGWVVDGDYAAVRDLVWAHADTVIWLDPPRHVVMRRLILRTLGRLVFRRRLWNGNRERWTNLVSWDPAKSLIAWAWTQHAVKRQRYAAAAADPALSHLHFIRLQSSGDVRALMVTLARGRTS